MWFQRNSDSFKYNIQFMSVLNIINEEGKVIGQDTRKNIHAKGLLHREIHVWFYTPKGEIIFQHRTKNKDTFPDMLDATVGGHVEIGDDFEDTALKEMVEETGVVVTKDKLKLIKTVRSNHVDPTTGKINNVIRKVFAYKFEGDSANLRVEDGLGEGFEVWPIAKLETVSQADAQRFIPSLLNEEYIKMYESFLLE